MMETAAPAAEAVVPNAATPKKAAKIPKVGKSPKSALHHPTYLQMIKDAIRALNDRKGASKQAIFKYIEQHFDLGDNDTMINHHARAALKKGVESRELHQTSGTGANGRFKVVDARRSSGHAEEGTPSKTHSKTARIGETKIKA